jgi:hypothetical protein
MAFKILGRSGKDLVTAGSSADQLSAEARRIINVAAPVEDTDVTNKEYVDDAVAAIDTTEALDGVFRIKNTTDPTKELAFDVSGVATATTRTIVMPNANVDLGLVATAVQSSQLGAASGVATLNAAGKLTSSQIPAIAITETFVVADIAARDALVVGEDDGEVQEGDVAVVEDASDDPNVSAGPASYIYNGTAWVQLQTPTSAVQSVNGQTGVVVLDSDDIDEGSVNLYYTSARFDADLATKDTGDLAEGTNLYYTQTRFDNAFAAKDSDDLDEGAVNLYFTEAKVLATVLTGFVAGSDTAIAATDTVLEALQKAQGQITAAKSSAAAAQSDADQALLDAAAAQTDIDNHIAAATGAHAATAISYDDSVTPSYVSPAANVQEALQVVDVELGNLDTRTDSLETAVNNVLIPNVGQVFTVGDAGESFAANQMWLVRRAKDGETAGRYYKAQANSSENSRVVGYIVTGSLAIDAGDSITVYRLGEASLGSSDTPFGATDINLPVYLSQTVAGKFTLAPSETAGQWLKEVGFVANTGVLEFLPGFLVQA